MMKVVIVEDERLASKRLELLLKKAEHRIEVVQILESVEDAVNWFSQNTKPSPPSIPASIHIDYLNRFLPNA